jgi:uncharacterized cupin superfamily protein
MYVLFSGMADPPDQITADELQAGINALQAGAWEEARGRFQASVAAGESAEALEQLGLAAGHEEAAEYGWLLIREGLL